MLSVSAVAQSYYSISAGFGGVSVVLLLLCGIGVTSAYFAEVNTALDDLLGKGKVRIAQLPTNCSQCNGVDNGPIECPADLDWSGETPSRWRNDWRGEDQGKYFLAVGNMPPNKVKYLFGSAPPPKAPYILTGALQNQPGRYLISDPIPRAERTAVLRFKMWVTPDVFLKVCIKEVNMFVLQNCTAMFNRSFFYNPPPDRVVRFIASIDKPFELVFWVGGYQQKSGGLGVIDEIVYTDSTLCGDDPSPLPSPDATINLAPDNVEQAQTLQRKVPIKQTKPNKVQTSTKSNKG